MAENKLQRNWEQQWLEGNISSQKAAEYAGSDSQFESLEKYVETTKNLRAPQKRTKEEAWQLLERRISEVDSTKVISISRRNWITGIAASLILAIGAFFIFQQVNRQITIKTALAEVRMVDLPDGSTIHLNAESSVSFSERGWIDSREVTLTGEAFFEVNRGSSFEVFTENGSVQVLGTSFNVRNRGEILQVACKTGTVKVRSADQSSEQTITQGLTVSVENNIVSKPIEISLDRIDSWIEGVYDYESIPLSQALNEVQRIYDIKIEHDFSDSELSNPITTTFTGLKDAAQTIALQKGRGYEVSEEDQMITFKKK